MTTNVKAMLAAIHDTGLGEMIRSVWWAFATLETLHFLGLCMLIGAMIVVDLRLIGHFKQASIKMVLPLTYIAIAGFVINTLSGIGFFASNPTVYYTNPAFRLKVLLILLAGLNVAWFELKERKKLLALPEGADPDRETKIVAMLSLMLWLGVLILGRLLPTFVQPEE